MTDADLLSAHDKAEAPTYMGERADQGEIVVGPSFPDEGFAVLTCGNTQVRLGYSALAAICRTFAADSRSSEFRTHLEFGRGLYAITCEASLGRTG